MDVEEDEMVKMAEKAIEYSAREKENGSSVDEIKQKFRSRVAANQ